MIRSMTGFGASSSEGKGWTVLAQVLSVNRPHLDVEVSFSSKDYLFLLPDVRQAVKERVRRGKVQVMLAIDASSVSREIVFNERLAKTLLAKLRNAEKGLPGDERISLRDILRVEGMLTTRSEAFKSPRLKPFVLGALKKALDAMDRMRLREGEGIAKDFSRQLIRMEAIIRAVRRDIPKAEKDYAEKLRARANTKNRLKGFSPEEEEMIMGMIGLFTDKADISEELSRLDSHILQFRHAVLNEASPGKTLNFITQEMLREANTTGSKTPSLSIKKRTIGLKSLIEEIKEQVSNVE